MEYAKLNSRAKKDLYEAIDMFCEKYPEVNFEELAELLGKAMQCGCAALNTFSLCPKNVRINVLHNLYGAGITKRIIEELQHY